MKVPHSTSGQSLQHFSSSFRLSWCARVLRQDGVVAYPTEAVWGLGCTPWSQNAVGKLLTLKLRSPERGVIVIGADVESLVPFIGEPVSENVRLLKQAIADSPGPTTWVVPAAVRVPKWVTGGYSSVALRQTWHPPAAALCRAYGGAIISSSANRSATRPAMTAWQVRRYFGYQLDALLPGEVGLLASPTPIKDLHTGEIMRA